MRQWIIGSVDQWIIGVIFNLQGAAHNWSAVGAIHLLSRCFSSFTELIVLYCLSTACLAVMSIILSPAVCESMVALSFGDHHPSIAC